MMGVNYMCHTCKSEILDHSQSYNPPITQAPPNDPYAQQINHADSD